MKKQSMHYDMKFIQKFLKGEKQQRIIKLIDTFKLQQEFNKLNDETDI